MGLESTLSLFLCIVLKIGGLIGFKVPGMVWTNMIGAFPQNAFPVVLKRLESQKC